MLGSVTFWQNSRALVGSGDCPFGGAVNRNFAQGGPPRRRPGQRRPGKRCAMAGAYDYHIVVLAAAQLAVGAASDSPAVLVASVRHDERYQLAALFGGGGLVDELFDSLSERVSICRVK
jgi:hypothetical protein